MAKSDGWVKVVAQMQTHLNLLEKKRPNYNIFKATISLKKKKNCNNINFYLINSVKLTLSIKSTENNI